MKTRNFLFVVAMILSAIYANAEGTQFGIKAGVNLANINSNIPDYSSDMRVGFHVGAGVSIKASNNFAVTIDLLYTQKGAKQTLVGAQTIPGAGSYTYKGEETITLSYIEFPILARVTTESGLYFTGGPYVGFLAGFRDEATVTVTTTVSGQSPTTTTESGSTTDDSGWSATDFGLKIGLGCKLAGGLDLSGNYSFGFINLIDVPSNSTYSAHNGVIGFTLGYWFGGK